MTPEAESLRDQVIAGQIRAHLAGISALWPMTAWVPAQRERRMRATPGPRSPANDAAIAARDEAREVLASWAGAVLEMRALRTRLDTADVPGICAWLAPHADLMAEVDGAGCEHELGRVRRALAEVSDVARKARVIQLGHTCPVAGCGGQLVGVVREGIPQDVRCGGREAHQWPRERWEHLGLALTAGGPLVPQQREAYERLVETVNVDARFL